MFIEKKFWLWYPNILEINYDIPILDQDTNTYNKKIAENIAYFKVKWVLRFDSIHT